MIFNTTNIVIFLILLALNSIAVLRSNRKRKFGLFPAQLFLFLFVAVWVGKIIVYFYVDKKAQDIQFSEVQVLSDFKDYVSKNSIGVFTKGLKTSSIKSVYYLRYTIRVASIQSLIATLFSFYGLISVYHRNEFYLKMLLSGGDTYMDEDEYIKFEKGIHTYIIISTNLFTLVI